MKYIKRNIVRHKLPKVYRVPYRTDAFRECERWLTIINYMFYRDVKAVRPSISLRATMHCSRTTKGGEAL